MNVKSQLEFEIAYFNVTVQYVKHQNTETLPSEVNNLPVNKIMTKGIIGSIKKKEKKKKNTHNCIIYMFQSIYLPNPSITGRV